MFWPKGETFGLGERQHRMCNWFLPQTHIFWPVWWLGRDSPLRKSRNKYTRRDLSLTLSGENNSASLRSWPRTVEEWALRLELLEDNPALWVLITVFIIPCRQLLFSGNMIPTQVLTMVSSSVRDECCVDLRGVSPTVKTEPLPDEVSPFVSL